MNLYSLHAFLYPLLYFLLKPLPFINFSHNLNFFSHASTLFDTKTHVIN